MDDDLGRWADPSLLVMTSLAAGPKHGYAIMQDVAEGSGVRLGPGTLYGVIARLEERGLIEPLAAQDRRRPYRITAEGSRVLATQLERMRAVAETGLGRLAGAPVTWSCVTLGTRRRTWPAPARGAVKGMA